MRFVIEGSNKEKEPTIVVKLCDDGAGGVDLTANGWYVVSLRAAEDGGAYLYRYDSINSDLIQTDERGHIIVVSEYEED